MRAKVWAWLLQRLQERCEHEHAIADLLEGEGTSMVGWCRVCGATRINVRRMVHGSSTLERGPWRRPRPLWYVGR